METKKQAIGLEDYLKGLRELNKTPALLDFLNKKVDELAEIIKSECDVSLGPGVLSSLHEPEGRCIRSYTRCILDLKSKKSGEREGYVVKIESEDSEDYSECYKAFKIGHGKEKVEYAAKDDKILDAIDKLKMKLIGEVSEGVFSAL